MNICAILAFILIGVNDDYQYKALVLDKLARKTIAWKDNFKNIEAIGSQFNFKFNKNKTIVPFGNIQHFERDLFIIMVAESYMCHIVKIQEELIDFLKEIENNEDGDAFRPDLLELLKELNTTKKVFLEFWKKNAAEIFSKYPNKFENSEKNFYLKRIDRFFNDR